MSQVISAPSNCGIAVEFIVVVLIFIAADENGSLVTLEKAEVEALTADQRSAGVVDGKLVVNRRSVLDGNSVVEVELSREVAALRRTTAGGEVVAFEGEFPSEVEL